MTLADRILDKSASIENVWLRVPATFICYSILFVIIFVGMFVEWLWLTVKAVYNTTIDYLKKNLSVYKELWHSYKDTF